MLLGTGWLVPNLSTLSFHFCLDSRHSTKSGFKCLLQHLELLSSPLRLLSKVATSPGLTRRLRVSKIPINSCNKHRVVVVVIRDRRLRVHKTVRAHLCVCASSICTRLIRNVAEEEETREGRVVGNLH